MDSNEEVRDRSGGVTSSDPVVKLLYILMRDHLTPGVVDTVVSQINSVNNATFTNGWLAEYAQDLVLRMNNADPK